MRQATHDLQHQPTSKSHQDGVYAAFHQHSTAPRVNTDAFLVEKIRQKYPSLHLTITTPYTCNLLSYASAGHAHAVSIDTEDGVTAENLKHRQYAAPARRLDGNTGVLFDSVEFGKYVYTWDAQEFIVYSVIGSEGLYESSMTYLLGGSALENDKLILAVCKWGHNIHNKVLIFDGGYWQTSAELWQSVQSANWEDVILEEGMKKSIIGEVDKFFGSRERYQKLRVPWKRGVIFHGPPGNGKTISIKATMHTLYSRPDPIPTLYVRSLSGYAGPEASLSTIFGKARQQAPCFLVFEDLDSIVTDSVRSYFLNEVDGLRNNDGILMVGSTNHLDRLDPGISKRPSRFDRKYLFSDPSMEQRVQYCEYWRTKLSDNEDIEFPEILNKAIASITKGFSFAYIQEAFVAALLAIANAGDDELEDNKDEENEKGDETLFGKMESPGHFCYRFGRCTSWDHPCHCGKTRFERWRVDAWENEEDLEKYVLWTEMKKVVKTLREELEQEERGVRGGVERRGAVWKFD